MGNIGTHSLSLYCQESYILKLEIQKITTPEPLHQSYYRIRDFRENNISSFNDICYMLLTYLSLDQTPGAETKHISTNTQTYCCLP